MKRVLLLVVVGALAFPSSSWAGNSGSESKTDGSEWPYQRPLFGLYAPNSTEVHLGVGWATNPDVDSLAFHVAASVAIGDFQVSMRFPMGTVNGALQDATFTFGDLELGVKWHLFDDQSQQKHLSVGIDFLAPTSRAGEEGDLASLQSGQNTDTSNFGKRYLLAQKPLLQMGLIPKLNVGVVPYVALGRNLGRVSLQSDIGCMVLVMDNIDSSIYGTNRRVGVVMFFDLAAPVALTRQLSIVTEFNSLVALDGLVGTGFAFTLGARYRIEGFNAGAGVQLPVGVDGKGTDDDKMPGRYDSAWIARHHWAVVLDLGYTF